MLKIVTHSSGFHTDDVFAVATLSLVLEKEGKEFSITRSREQVVIEAADYVVDVGGIYDPSINRFDHHQEGGAGKRENGIPYASFGLVWKHYGEVLCGNNVATERIDQSIVQPIDSGDNGLQYLDYRFQDVRPFDVGHLTHLFSLTWKENPEEVDNRFQELVSYAKFIMRRVITVANSDIEAEGLVYKNYEESEDKRLVVLDNGRFPWERVLSKLPEPLFVVYENITAGTWSVKTIRNDPGQYEPRKKLPQAWAGKKDEELEKITGVVGAVFCHNARFMAVAKTKEAILQMAELALKN